MVFPLVSGRKRFRVAVAADAALISTEAIFCTGRILGRYHRILMAGGRIIGIFGFGSGAGLAATDIIAVLGASVRYGFPKRPIVYMLCGLVIVQLRQNLCLGGVAAGADPECGSGGAGCGFLGGDPFAKGMTQGGNLGIRIGIAAELTGMRGVASGAARGLDDLSRIIVGLLRGVIVYVGVLADGAGMGGIAPGGTGGSGYGIFIGVCQTVNAFRIAAAAGTGVGFDASCRAGGFSGDLKGILMGVSFYELVQFLILRCAANCAGALGQALGRSGRLLRYNPITPGVAGRGAEIILIAIATGAGVGGIALSGAGGICGLFGILVDVVQGNILHINPAIGNASPDGSVNGGLFKHINDAAALQLRHDIVLCTGSFTDVEGIRVVHDARDAYGGGFNCRFGSRFSGRLCGCLRCRFGGGFCSWYGGRLFHTASSAAV